MFLELLTRIPVRSKFELIIGAGPSAPKTTCVICHVTSYNETCDVTVPSFQLNIQRDNFSFFIGLRLCFFCFATCSVTCVSYLFLYHILLAFYKTSTGLVLRVGLLCNM